MEPTLPPTQLELFPEHVSTYLSEPYPNDSEITSRIATIMSNLPWHESPVMRSQDTRVGYNNLPTNTVVTMPPRENRTQFNEWYLLVDRCRIVGVRLNGRNIDIDSVTMSSESGGITTLNLSVLIVPGRDILGMTSVLEEPSPEPEINEADTEQSVMPEEVNRTRFIDI